MSTYTSVKLAPYIAGGLLALLSEGLLGASFGVPTPLNITRSLSSYTQSVDLKVQQDFAQLAQVVPQNVAVAQQVDRTRKGDRLIGAQSLSTFGVAPEVTFRGTLTSDNLPVVTTVRKPMAKPVSEQRLPEGCNSSISPLSDRVAANQASNCVTSLELPWKVASAN